MIKRNLFSIGSSRAVTIPFEWIRQTKAKAVDIREDDKGNLVLVPLTEQIADKLQHKKPKPEQKPSREGIHPVTPSNLTRILRNM